MSRAGATIAVLVAAFAGGAAALADVAPGPPAIPIASTGTTPTLAPAAPALTVSAAPSKAGAQNVALTLGFSYVMRCGQRGPAPILVVLPNGFTVPEKIARTAVLLDGKPAPAVTVSGRKVTVATPKATGVQCDVLTVGTAKIVFTRAAGIGSPPHAGTYLLGAVHGATARTARLTLS